MALEPKPIWTLVTCFRCTYMCNPVLLSCGRREHVYIHAENGLKTCIIFTPPATVTACDEDFHQNGLNKRGFLVKSDHCWTRKIMHSATLLKTVRGPSVDRPDVDQVMCTNRKMLCRWGTHGVTQRMESQFKL